MENYRKQMYGEKKARNGCSRLSGLIDVTQQDTRLTRNCTPLKQPVNDGELCEQGYYIPKETPLQRQRREAQYRACFRVYADRSQGRDE